MTDSPVRIAPVRRVGDLDAPPATDSDLVAAEEPLQLEIEHGPAGARARRVLVRSSACGLCGRDAIDDLAGLGARVAAGGPPISASVIRALPARLRERQAVFNETGGRHNAVDKLVGANLREPASPAILVVSGRAAFEIVHKAVMAGVPVLAAVGAPSSLAVETARAFNLTLVGFLRDDRFNIYSAFERIV